jgi:REP element-mobilizing transposase RayT
MALFQSTVIQKYINAQDQSLLKEKWEAYKTRFLDPKFQENIRNAKEEQYQEGFLRDLFVKILGYTLNPTVGFNLTTELKNVKDSKKADGGIIVNDKVVGVIELKGTNTTDLSKIEAQAFGYKNNQSSCTYVITSNFEKIRFYIDNAIEHEVFNLFELTEEDFSLLYLCLAYENIKRDIPKKIKNDSHNQEDITTKQLYKDYSIFKRELYNNLVELNPEYEPLLLFKKSQKLLDRFLFLFFAEDRHLLPPNSVRLILQQWKQLKELDAYTPLYKRFKKYFGYLNTGHKGKQYDVYPYNGGLFRPDEVLDKITINDDLLYKYTLRLSEYDFDSEVDVNILGHIFENSLNEIEEIQTQLEENPSEVKISKRKKDGVFYTPKYITKYIVENTIGKLCEEKKTEVNIVEEDYNIKRQSKTKKDLLKKLNTYRDWLLQLTVVDPACGSGAFLSEALNYLIAEHQYLDELETKLMGGGLVFPNVENSILENNLFGVDINNESVEIAKLSLWLRTAQPNRKLNDLSNNIKCGNSLIDDPEVAGDKAFNWEKEFPQVFQEKDKHAYHITTALHDSRTSKRMLDHKVREKREGGSNPFPNYEKLTAEEEVLIAEEVLGIVKEDKLKILAFNVCADHIHILLVCEEEDVPKILQKIKAKTARTVNIHKGITIPSTREHASNHISGAPLPQRGKKQNSLWTQKYGCKPITDETQLHNTINYIQHNRSKHNLPESQTLNKLIDNLCCTLEEAFTPEYKGGFDVVIGNPPYLRKQGLVESYPVMCDYYENKYQSATANYDIYALFIERSFELIQEKGIVSYILPHKFLVTDFGVGIRQFFIENKAVESILHFGSEMVFADASTYTCIINLDKSKKDKVHFKKINPLEINNPFDWDYALYENLNESNWDLQSQKVFELIDKLKKQPYKINNVFGSIFQGIASSLDAVYTFEGVNKDGIIKAYNSKYDYHFEIEKDIVKPFIKGNEISKYKNLNNSYYVLFPYDNNGEPVDEEYIQSNLPKTYSYLKHFESEIRGREKGKMDIETGWYLYIYPKSLTKFGTRKIMTQEISKGCNMTYDQNGEFYHPTTIYSFVKKDKFEVDEKFYLGIFNSKVMWFFLKNTGTELRGGYFRFKTNYLKPFPLPEIPSKPRPYIEKVNSILDLNKELQEVSSKFQRSLQRQFPEELEKLPKKLQDWYELSYASFIKELKKKKIKLSLSQEAEWEDYFLSEQEKATNLKTQIDQTDKEIDQMVYELYGLTEEEIEIVENS